MCLVIPAASTHFLTGRFIHDGSGNPANTNNSPSFALRKDYMLALKLAYTQHLLSLLRKVQPITTIELFHLRPFQFLNVAMSDSC